MKKKNKFDTRRFFRYVQGSVVEYTSKEAAEYLNINYHTFRGFVKLGIIQPATGGSGRGKRHFFHRDDLDALREKMDSFSECV